MLHRERDRQRQWNETQKLETERNRDNEIQRKRQGGIEKRDTEKET